MTQCHFKRVSQRTVHLNSFGTSFPYFLFKLAPIKIWMLYGVMRNFIFISAQKGGVARAMGEGEKEKECTTEGKSRRRRDEKAPWELNYGSGEGGGVEKRRRRGGENRY